MRVGLRRMKHHFKARWTPELLDLWDDTVPVDVFSFIEALGVELHYGELGGGRLAEAQLDSLTLNDRLPAKKARVVAALALVRYLNGEYLFEVDGTESESIVQAARELLVPEPTVRLSSFEVSDFYEVPLGWAS